MEGFGMSRVVGFFFLGGGEKNFMFLFAFEWMVTTGTNGKQTLSRPST
jgi:hypothetical protein